MGQYKMNLPAKIIFILLVLYSALNLGGLIGLYTGEIVSSNMGSSAELGGLIPLIVTPIIFIVILLLIDCLLLWFYLSKNNRISIILLLFQCIIVILLTLYTTLFNSTKYLVDCPSGKVENNMCVLNGCSYTYPQNPNQQGIAIIGDIKQIDLCNPDGKSVKKYMCGSINVKPWPLKTDYFPYARDFTCTKGCNNGACTQR